MTLLVNTFIRTSAGDMDIVEPDSHADELAGFESYRHTLYGSRAALALGFQLLPKLKTEDIYAEGVDLERLQTETELALANIELFEDESGGSAETLRFRFENILKAVRQARRIGGGVVLW